MQKHSAFIGETVKTVFWALIIAFFIRSFLVQSFTIPTGSMIPTLKVGDFVAVSKISHGYSRHSLPLSPPIMDGKLFARSPKLGEVLVFKSPMDNRADFIKRVMGLPGDRVKMRGGQLYINDVLVEKTPTGKITHEYGFVAVHYRETLPNGKSYIIQQYECGPALGVDCRNYYGKHQNFDNTPEYVVPPHSFFVIGDNRDNSTDSRADQFTFIPNENIVGRAKIVFLSFDGAKLSRPWTWITRFQPSRIFKSAQG